MSRRSTPALLALGCGACCVSVRNVRKTLRRTRGFIGVEGCWGCARVAGLRWRQRGVPVARSELAIRSLRLAAPCERRHRSPGLLTSARSIAARIACAAGPRTHRRRIAVA